MDIDTTGLLDPSRYVGMKDVGVGLAVFFPSYYDPYLISFYNILSHCSFVGGGNNSPTTEELLSGGNRSGTGRYVYY